MGEAAALERIEEVIDALESRDSTSSIFHTLCSELHILLDALPNKLVAGTIDDVDVKKQINSIINRLRKLETFANAQSEITSGLQKFIANPDK